ncbi:DUF3558 family protein [Nocardia veterana]|uniref:DUF3558 family protein n=1 Tax=Nocardia veterana TaxID=132249 RepID=A0A7X6RIA9_9NOCA|nr:DUF3558 family protein [Nocardia veterana]NKY86374.1 DUF3558 family protein [Nocardia veterana]
MKRQLLALLLGAALTGTVTGCGSDDSPGIASETTASSTTESTRALPNPCDLPEQKVTASDLITTDRITHPVGSEFAGWKGCIWKSRAGWYDAGVYVGPMTVAEFRKDSRFGDYTAVAPTTVASKPGTDFADRLDPDRRERCYIAADMSYGMVWFMARIPYVRDGEQAPGDPCVEVRRISAELVDQMG